VDDVPFGGSSNLSVGGAAPDIDPNDLARIEVLRGPQGTLYGASSIGGLLKFVTRDPSTDEFSGYATGTVNGVRNGDSLGVGVRAGANIPLGDDFAVRVSGFTRRDPGYIDDPVLGIEGLNETDVDGGRLSALWRPSSTISFRLNALIQHTTSDGSGHVNPDIGGDLQQSAPRGTGWFDKKLQAYSGLLNMKLGSADLTALSGYSINRFDNAEQLGAFTPASAGVLLTYLETKRATQEIRLSLPLGTKAEWLVGAFYNKEDSPSLYQAIDDVNPVTGAQLANEGTYTFPFFSKEYAAFTDLTYHFTDRFDVQIGGRQSRNTQDYVPSFAAGRWKSEDSSFTYLLTPRFKLSPDLMVYARLASGYRPGGPNTALTSPLTGPPQYDPDTTRNYEVGIKGVTFDHALSFDASVYYIDWKKFQILVFPPGQRAYYDNGGGAVSRGVEFSIDATPRRGMSVQASLSWNDAELTEDLPPNTAVGLDGDRLPYGSRLSGSLSIEQSFSITTNLMGTVGGSVSYVGDRKGVFTATGVPRETFPSYAQLDLRASARYDTWTWNVFLNNVTDKRGILGGGSGGSDFPGAYWLIQPRTLGMSVSKTL
jgi:outer membrane receptor protein involved in Fe transport